MRRYHSLAALLGAFVLASCGDRNPIQKITAPTAGAAVKFSNFGVNAPAVNFYANDKKLSGISSTSCSSSVDGTTTDPACLSTGKEPTTGTAYGANASNGLYYSVGPGSYTLTGRITATTDNGVAIASAPATLENGKFYSYYVSGIYNSAAKSAESFIVEDPLPDIDFSQAYVRFVNAISNSQPMVLYATLQTSGTETAIGPAVAYKAAGPFVAVPIGVYDLNTREAGSSTNLITSKSASFAGGHVYTITARGDMTVTSTTASTRPILDNTANR